MRRSSITGLLFLLCVTGCEAEYPEGRFSCATAVDCPSGWVCEQRSAETGLRCYRMLQDASAPDSCADAAGCEGPCTVNADCSNGVYCDGEERCDPSDALADEFGCTSASTPVTCDDGIACTTDACSNALARCTFTAPDADEDGHTDVMCLDGEDNPLGDDCDDTDADRYPGNPEVCDDNGVDEDCDPSTLGFKDDDGDGSIDAKCCNTGDGGATQCGLDCDDEDLAVHSYQPEFCDGIDNDCDVDVDEVQNALPWYADDDMDGFGFGEPVVTSCTPQPGRSLLNNDCDDTDAQVSPRQPEICDGVDDNCNGVADERLNACDTSPEPGAVLPVNECVNGLSDCAPAASCRDMPTGFSCLCPAGSSGDGRGSDGCADVDECLTENGGCDTDPMATCENQIGAPRTCICPQPYAGSGIGSQGCVEGDPCLVNNGGCDSSTMATCQWTPGNLPTCTCPAFYENAGGDSTRCVDINECDVNNGGCGSSTFYRCTNNDGAPPTCDPIDVCSINNGGCDTAPMAACSQSGVSITCTCPSGNFGNGMGTNGCVDCGTIANCATAETCNPTGGGNLVCPTCASGYTGSGSAECMDINECLTMNGGCDTSPMALCTNMPGGRVCACPGDYVGAAIGIDGCVGIERGPTPTTESASAAGPYTIATYTSGYRDGPDFGAATIYRPTSASPPLAMVVFVPGFTATQTSIATWGPFLASHGIVTMTVDTNTTNADVPTRAAALMDALVSLRGEHTRMGSPLNGQLDLDRTALMGWSMGGGGAWLASSTNPTLRASISVCGTLSGTALTAANITVPTLLFAGSADSGVLGLGQSQPVYVGIPGSASKMLYEIAGGDHYVGNNPANQSGTVGRYALSWLKVFLEGDERYRTFLLATPPNASDFRDTLN